MESPRVRSVSWGKIEIDGHGSMKDAKLWPGGARAWDWGETGTHHRPGTLPADVRELLEHGAREIVLTRGMLGRLGVAPETLTLLEQEGVPCHVATTKKAVQLYNERRKEVPVGGLFHTTC